MSRKLFRLILLSLPFMILVSAIFAFTASNTVSVSGLDYESHDITANQLKPAACDGLDLATIITDGDDGNIDGVINGTIGNDLLLGTDGPNTLHGGGGDGIDCFVAGAGEDTCNGGAGADVFIDCETETP